MDLTETNPFSETPTKALTVADFTRQVKHFLESAIPACWIRGEVSNVRKQSSGHWYFSVKDSASQLNCVLFRGDAARQSSLPAEGTQILVYGRINIYEPRGSYQLIVRKILADGVGALQIRYEQLKKKLAADGLFDAANKRSLPLLPLRIAVVTSPTGAAIRDFIGILERRAWKGRITILPALVQGTEAAADICRALEQVAASPDAYDAVVVTRGGGSLEDLWPFNEERVVRMLASMPIPTISAVGHEIDTPLTDFAADVRAETPSGAAELISSLFLRANEQVTDLGQHLQQLISNALTRWKHAADAMGLRLENRNPKRRVETLNLKIDDLHQRLHHATQTLLSRRQHRIEQLQGRLLAHHPRATILRQNDRIGAHSARLQRAVSVHMKASAETLRQLARRLENNGIERTLRRGFAMTEHPDGSLIQSAKQVSKGDVITIRWHDGAHRGKVDC